MANDFVHCELNTDDVNGAQGFYGKLFAWKIAPYPGMEYLGVNTGSKVSGGGIQKKPMAQMPTAWMPYVGVKDVKGTLEKAAQLGAQITLPYQELGDGMGAIGAFVDPTGAALGVYEAGTPPPKPKKATSKKAKSAKKKKR